MFVCSCAVWLHVGALSQTSPAPHTPGSSWHVLLAASVRASARPRSSRCAAAAGCMGKQNITPLQASIGCRAASIGWLTIMNAAPPARRGGVSGGVGAVGVLRCRRTTPTTGQLHGQCLLVHCRMDLCMPGARWYLASCRCTMHESCSVRGLWRAHRIWRAGAAGVVAQTRCRVWWCGASACPVSARCVYIVLRDVWGACAGLYTQAASSTNVALLGLCISYTHHLLQAARVVLHSTPSGSFIFALVSVIYNQRTQPADHVELCGHVCLCCTRAGSLHRVPWANACSVWGSRCGCPP